mmetsp:Transcript_26313/g.49425  ORF Transcript_26313/g.49425 Transcript_26313/m.49425 type:complete len:89 (+) Transcript_26313:105-371(+)
MPTLGRLLVTCVLSVLQLSWALPASSLRTGSPGRVDEETLQAMLREIEDDEGLQALSEEVSQRFRKPSFQIISGASGEGRKPEEGTVV